MILCFRTDNPNVLLVDGASKAKCEKCQYDVWISPSSLKIRENKGAIIVCNICEDLRLKPGVPIPVLPLNNDQITEIKDALWNRNNRN